MAGPETAAQEKVYQLKIALLHVTPSVWRRLRVPGNMPLDVLDAVIQIAMGWDDFYEHRFTIEGKQYADPVDLDYDSSKQQDESNFVVSQVLPKAGIRFEYAYGWPEPWHHEVVVESIGPVDPAMEYPICIEGERAAPPEDVHEVGGYERFLAAINNPKHPDHQAVRQWWNTPYDPEEFDLEAINEELSELEEYLADRAMMEAEAREPGFEKEDAEALYEQILQQLGQLIVGVDPMRDGYLMHLPGDVVVAAMAAQFVMMEHQRHPDLKIVLEVGPNNGPIWLSVTGPAQSVRAIRDALGIVGPKLH